MAYGAATPSEGLTVFCGHKVTALLIGVEPVGAGFVWIPYRRCLTCDHVEASHDRRDLEEAGRIADQAQHVAEHTVIGYL
jgi:hypothetical protein